MGYSTFSNVNINSQPNRPYRYDFFTIWGNALNSVDDILEIIRNETDLNIIKIQKITVKHMKQFVYKLYGCDSVPVSHLKAKLRYLFKSPNEIIFVFVRNKSPEESYIGNWEFRHKQSLYINGLKKEIRDLYNPRVNGVRTEEHVIHASDYEEQVDYVVKLLNIGESVDIFEGQNPSIPFYVPYYLNKFQTVTIKDISINELKATLLIKSNSGKVTIKLVGISNTPHYKFLIGEKEDYESYVRNFRFTYLLDDHYSDKLERMKLLSDTQVKRLDPVIVTPGNGFYRILDGIHRASIVYYNKLDTIKCAIVTL